MWARYLAGVLARRLRQSDRSATRGIARVALAAAPVLTGLVLWAPAAGAQGAVTYFSDAFTESSTTSAVTPINGEDYEDSASTGLPCLTAGTSTTQTPIAGCGLGAGADPSGAGALRLTGTGADEVSAVLGTTPLPTAAGLDITFTEAQYAPVTMAGTTAGDGLSFFLNSGSQNPVEVGGDRGSLAYSPDLRHGAPGLLDGYLGVGFDQSGLYGTANSGGENCTGATTTPTPGQVVVRGSGVGFNGYCVLATSATAVPDPLGPTEFQGTTRASSERAVQILLNPVAMTVSVGIGVPGTGTYTTVAAGPLPAEYYDIEGDASPGLPPTVYFGLGGDTDTNPDNVTGAPTTGDIHEITGLTISSLLPAAVTAPTPATPESPVVIGLPIVGALAGWGVLRRRRQIDAR
jgi:hypothetical protein